MGCATAMVFPTVLSEHAPRITILKINPDKIKDIIGPGGKTIRSIVETHGVKIDVLQEGDEVMVKVLEIDRQGKIRLSRKDAMNNTAESGR